MLRKLQLCCLFFTPFFSFMFLLSSFVSSSLLYLSVYVCVCIGISIGLHICVLFLVSPTSSMKETDTYIGKSARMGSGEFSSFYEIPSNRVLQVGIDWL